ncbi:hypothetical protein GQ53DRAFT_761969 [Thozetella sp. PMI_491]|nr:hypothetical protein GQ53DRAFT_761969 [Thozetella sp. PMI_491]
MNDSAVIRITSGSQFSTLSTINKELHRLAERMSHQLEGISLESFVRVVLEPNDASASIAPYQTLMKLSQEYLQAIKSLHRSIGTDSMLLHYLETFFVISKARLDDPSDRLIPPAQETFAGVRVLEFLTQGAMFVEGLRNVLSQIILVLGFPTGTWWSGRTVWTGLLADTRYRDILNQELGSVEDGWSTRPARLMELIDACRAMIMDASMLGS